MAKKRNCENLIKEIRREFGVSIPKISLVCGISKKLLYQAQDGYLVGSRTEALLLIGREKIRKNLCFNCNRPMPTEPAHREEPEPRGIAIEDPIEDLYLNVRASNALKAKGLQTVKELIQMTKHDVLKLKNVGKGTVKHIEDCLSDLNLSLKP